MNWLTCRLAGLADGKIAKKKIGSAGEAEAALC